MIRHCPPLERSGRVPDEERSSCQRAAHVVARTCGDDDDLEAAAATTAEKPMRQRRKRRFGNIFSRKWDSGRRTWSAVWFCRRQQRRLTRAFATEREARTFLAEVERRVLIEAYEVPPTLAEAKREDERALVADERPPVPTLVAYAEDVIERRFRPMLSKGSIGVYRAALRAWKTYFGEHTSPRSIRLDEVSPSIWLDYRSWRATARNSRYGNGTTVSPRTINVDQACLIRILGEAVLDGHIERNPLAGMKKLRETRRQRRYLAKEELASLITHCPDHFRPFLVTAAYTGARKGELTRLHWSDIDFAGGKIALYRPKVGNGDWIDLHPAVAAELQRLRASREDARDDDHVFLSRHGTPFVEVRRSFILALRAAGLDQRPGLTFHSLRHSFATHFLQNGGAVTDLQQQLGHAELATTQIYASALSERRRAAVMALDFGGRTISSPPPE